MNIYLMIDADGLVQNAAMWDGVSPYELPYGWTAAELNDGEYYEFGKPRGIAPPAPPPAKAAAKQSKRK